MTADQTHTCAKPFLNPPVPVIVMKPCRINGKIFEWILISRRSCFRAGVRYYVRGIDSEGHAANFVETEQITRGSMPFYWSQRPNLKYKPKPIISKTTNHVNQKGSEKPLEQAFDKMVSGMNNGMLNYIAFDFHKECSAMRWERLQILVDLVAETQDEYSYFMVTSEGKTVAQQRGVFRSNCMDCLDRTNRMGVLNVGQRIEEQAEFEKIYKNGNVSTGKRTRLGLLMDGWNSMIRYYKNNFSDGFRQDSIDLFLGNFAVDESDGPTPLRVQKDWKFLTLPIVMLVAFSMCIVCLLMAVGHSNKSNKVKCKLRHMDRDPGLCDVLGAASAITATIILFNGQDFVDSPKLVHKEKLD
ncbi:hypothetical protein F7725_025616 [Dissostichus mawsoni]|uniref:SAC domain-containing protein n=1 Tax=Dissostichus mawsoni TaxID=36200 RepID=A0A7J5XBL6_DISMA|nr:hypothetical protein F7725_025616 [Dissostichus mawsoni]